VVVFDIVVFSDGIDNVSDGVDNVVACSVVDVLAELGVLEDVSAHVAAMMAVEGHVLVVAAEAAVVVTSDSAVVVFVAAAVVVVAAVPVVVVAAETAVVVAAV
jgi:hypothetical protein